MQSVLYIVAALATEIPDEKLSQAATLCESPGTYVAYLESRYVKEPKTKVILQYCKSYILPLDGNVKPVGFWLGPAYHNVRIYAIPMEDGRVLFGGALVPKEKAGTNQN